LVYIRWEMADGSFQCRLVAGKTRVAPKTVRLTVPRMELQAALLSVRLAARVRAAMRMEFEDVRYFTDNTSVLGMIRSDSASMVEFVGTRVSEIKSKSDPEKEWFWVETSRNLADMGTRKAVKPADLGEESEYQNGMEWMCRPEREWGWGKYVNVDAGPVPAEELRKDMTRIAAAAAVEESWPPYPPRVTSLAKLKRIYGYVMWFAARMKKMEGCERLPMVETVGRKTKLVPPCPPRRFQAAAEQMLLEAAQRKLGEEQKVSLAVMEETVDGVLGETRTILVVGGRSLKHLKGVYGEGRLPVLPGCHPLSRMYVREAHEKDHGGVSGMVLRSRAKVWVVQAGKVAKAIKEHCFRCRYLAKRCGEQLMGPLPNHRVGPAPIFDSTAVDLFGPFNCVDPYNKRKTIKCWGVVFVCTATSAVHVEVAQSYSTESFLMALRNFMSIRGAPRRFQSDQGDQLVAASKQIATWDWAKVHAECENKGATWRLVPTGGQHYNGQAERIIGLIKLCLERTLVDKRMGLEEVTTVLREAAMVVNSRPLGLRTTEDPSGSEVVTPLHLMLGRGTMEVPEVKFDLQPSLTRRLRQVEEAKEEFWRMWTAQIFQGQVLAQKWRKTHRDMMVGDLVMIKNENAAGVDYQRGRVRQTFMGEDGHVRSAEVEYRNASEKVFRTTTRPIQKLVVLVPVDYKFEDDIANKQ